MIKVFESQNPKDIENQFNDWFAEQRQQYVSKITPCCAMAGQGSSKDIVFSYTLWVEYEPRD